MLGVLQAPLPLILDAGTALVSVPPLSCAGFVHVCSHCTGRWAVLDNTQGKESGCTATTMALTSIKQKVSLTAGLTANTTLHE